MTWLTSLPAAVLVISGLVLTLLVATGGRPWIERLSVHESASRTTGAAVAH